MSCKLIFSRKECHAEILQKSRLHELQGTLIGRDGIYQISSEGDSYGVIAVEHRVSCS